MSQDCHGTFQIRTRRKATPTRTPTASNTSGTTSTLLVLSIPPLSFSLLQHATRRAPTTAEDSCSEFRDNSAGRAWHSRTSSVIFQTPLPQPIKEQFSSCPLVSFSRQHHSPCLSALPPVSPSAPSAPASAAAAASRPSRVSGSPAPSLHSRPPPGSRPSHPVRSPARRSSSRRSVMRGPRTPLSATRRSRRSRSSPTT